MPKFKHLRANIDKVSAKQYNMLVDDVEAMYQSLLMNGFISSSGILARRPMISSRFIMRIFEVQSIATGNGVYNCYEQKLNKLKWNSTNYHDKFEDENTTLIEVLNLHESSSTTDHAPALCLYDLIEAWKTKDDNEIRWIGKSLTPPVRLAKTSQAVRIEDLIQTANIILNTGSEANDDPQLGYNISVNYQALGSITMHRCIPNIGNNIEIPVYNHLGKWYYAGTLQGFDLPTFQIVDSVFKDRINACT